MNRFQDQGYKLYHFEDEIFVACPNCEERAVVNIENPRLETRHGTLNCSNCSFSLDGRELRYRMELKCNCPDCGARIERHMDNVKERQEEIAVRCDECENTQSYKPRFISYECGYPDSGLPSDPYYNLPLWMHLELKGNVLWAYNYRHLDYLKSYVSAGLRERKPHGVYWMTMLERLPDWMKSAKNREAVLKGFDKLLRI